MSAHRRAADRGPVPAACQVRRHRGSGVQRWEGSPKRCHAIMADITLAIVNVSVGEPRGLPLAHKAIASVAEIRSTRVRARLRNLVAALEGRPESDCKELARRARKFSLKKR